MHLRAPQHDQGVATRSKRIPHLDIALLPAPDQDLRAPRVDANLRVAMNDEHPGQMAALKFAGERILPISAFEAAKQAGGTPTIQINVSSLVGASSSLPEPVVVVDDVVDVEVKEK